MVRAERHLVFFATLFFFFSSFFTRVCAVEFSYSLGGSLTSTYVWRGMYNGGLSFQPEVYIGYEGDLSEFSVGAWGNVGLSDWRFDFKNNNEEQRSFFVPELDICADFVVLGACVGFVHYYYFGGSAFLSWGNINTLDAKGNTSQTEVYVGYDFSYLLDWPIRITWNTIVAGMDGYLVEVESEKEESEEDVVEEYRRAYSTYIELNYELSLKKDMALLFQLGIAPWRSLYNFYEHDFSITNIGIQFGKTWFFENDFYVKLFVGGSINPWGIRGDNVFIRRGGELKLDQRLNGQIGMQFGI